jgi:hypothetical protein
MDTLSRRRLLLMAWPPSVNECGARPNAAPNISRFRQDFDASASLASRDRVLI